MMGVRQNPTWSCKIGIRGECELREGADLPMRKAVEAAFEKLTGVEAQFNFSGWGASLDEHELAVVENREPSEEHYRQWCIQQAAPDLLAALEELTRELRWVNEQLDLMPDEYAEAQNKATAAIAKARGDA